MKLKKNQIGVVHLAVVLVIAIVIVAGFAAFRIMKMNDKDSNSQSQPSTNSKVDQAKSSNNLQSYTNKDLNIVFSYPKSWGTVKLEKFNGETGHRYKILFSNDSNAKAGVMSSDFSAGADGGCYAFLGIFPGQDLASYKKDTKDNGQNLDKNNGFVWTTNELLSTSTSYVYEGLGAGTVNGPGDCAGYHIKGYKIFDSNQSYKGIQFFYGEEKEVPITALDEFKSKPEDFFSTQARQEFIDLVKSAESL